MVDKLVFALESFWYSSLSIRSRMNLRATSFAVLQKNLLNLCYLKLAILRFCLTTFQGKFRVETVAMVQFAMFISPGKEKPEEVPLRPQARDPVSREKTSFVIEASEPRAENIPRVSDIKMSRF